MRFILGLTLLTGLAFGCGDDDGPVGPGTDAGPRDSGTTSDSGGGGTDSGPDEDGGGPDEDSGTPEDGGGVDSGGGGGCPDLMPSGDETVIIAKVDFAAGVVEVFNPGATAVAVGTFQFCHLQAPRGEAYETMGEFGPANIPAGGYATYTLPDSWLMSASNGDLAIYRNGPFSVGANIIDYLCWGTGGGSNRLTEATSADKWDGSCLTGPTMGAITRLPSTSGTAAASYDTTSAFEATTCD